MSNLQPESPSFLPDFLTSRRIGARAVPAAAAATALWVRRWSRRAERDNPPVGKFIYIGGVRLHFVMRGQGPATGLLDQLTPRSASTRRDCVRGVMGDLMRYTVTAYPPGRCLIHRRIPALNSNTAVNTRFT